MLFTLIWMSMSLELQCCKINIHKIKIWNQNCMAQGTSLKLQHGISLISTRLLLCLSAFHISKALDWLQDTGRLFYISLLPGISLGILVKIRSHSMSDCMPIRYTWIKLVVNSVMNTQYHHSISLVPNHSIWTLIKI